MVEREGVVALDLETTGLDPRRSEIRLAQVSDGEKIFIIDLFKRDGRALFEALAREDLIVLAHGGDFEWRFIYHHYGIALENIVDTLLMARLAFCGDMTLRAGLGDIAESELDIVLDKEMQTADWTLQRRSKRLNHRTVAAVLEEAAGVFGTESRDRSAHRFEKSFSATRLGFTHQAFDLAECLLDGVEVR